MKLIAYSSSESGGMMGGYSSTHIFYTEDGRCKVETAGRTYHSQPIEHITYYADGLLEKLSEVCEKYNVDNWKDLPYDKINMLDAALSSKNFKFENGDNITLDSDKIYPQNIELMCRDMYQEIIALIDDSKNYGIDKKITEEEPVMSMGMMGMMGMTLQQAVQPVREQASTFQEAKFCNICGAKFLDEQKFCAECGAPRNKI